MYTKKLFSLDIPNIIITLLLLCSGLFIAKYNKTVGIILIVLCLMLFGLVVFDKLYTLSKIKKNYKKINDYIGNESTDNIQSIPIPVLFCYRDGTPVMYNGLFSEEVTGDNFLAKKNIAKIVDAYIHRDEVIMTVNAEFTGKKYSVFVSSVNSEDKNDLYVMYFIDNTYYKSIETEFNRTRPVVIIISIDSVDEASNVLPHGLFTSFFADTEKIITDWFTKRCCLFRKFGDDKFFAVTESKHLNDMISDRFEIVDKVRNYKINNKSAGLTLSIGVGTGTDVSGCEQFAKQALEMARGRGGDQTAIKNGENYQFFGGVSEINEKSSQIRSRAISKSIEEFISGSSDVIIMGHKNSDLDSLGSAIGLAGAVLSLKKNVNVVVDYNKSLAKSIIDYYKFNVDDKLFISPYEAEQMIGDKTLVIVVDTMRNVLVEDPLLYENAKKLVVIDHHRMSVDHISNADVFYHEPTVSSACEMVTNLLQYMPSNPKISSVYAECLLAGIYLDTKNFTLKTGVRTFEAAAYLRDCGADTVNVRKLFSASLSEYELVNNIVSSAEINGNIAVSYIKSEEPNLRISCAKAADTLLDIKNVDASFVVFDENKGFLNISARSYGKVNVQVIMEEIGGGGHQTMAAAQVKDGNFEEIKNKLFQIINKY